MLYSHSIMQPSKYPAKRIDSDYARIIYHVRVSPPAHSSSWAPLD